MNKSEFIVALLLFGSLVLASSLHAKDYRQFQLESCIKHSMHVYHTDLNTSIQECYKLYQDEWKE